MHPSPPEHLPEPYFPPPSQAPRKTIAVLRAADLARWLKLGGGDLAAYPWISIFYGVCFWGMALVLGVVFQSKPEYTMSIASGCLLLGPFLAVGLYEVSRRREQGLQPALATSLICWRPHLRSMGLLVLVLIVLELLWGRASLVVFAVFFNTGMPSTTGVVQAIFNPDNWEFIVAYIVVGGFFAALVFALSVVAIPMILDRDTDAISAAITSLEVVLNNLAVMLLWGACITMLVALALLAPLNMGLLLVGPLLGHASWHAYRGAVRWLEAPQLTPDVPAQRPA
jgi:uncharacterized membrane protein